MTKVFVDLCTSLDGYVAPRATFDAAQNSLWMQDWVKIVGWVFPQRAFRERLHMGEGGEEGLENQIVADTFARTGATIMGKTMFSAGEEGWPEEAPFHHDVYVLTHEKRDPWERPGGTTFHFVNDGVHAALERATRSAKGKDVRIGGGADVVHQYLAAGLVDELILHTSPTLVGRGVRLFEGIDRDTFTLELAETTPSPLVTHVRYNVVNK